MSNNNTTIKNNKAISNRRDFTPLKYSKGKLMNILTMDIETMKYPGNTVQLPVLITIAHLDVSNKQEITTFLLDKKILSDKGLNYAIDSMWMKMFNYLSKTVESLNKNNNNKSVIFMHNLGAFDGFFLFQALINLFDRKDSQTIIDKEHDFIQITAKINNIQLVWKDSLRIFDVKLDELCQTFEVKGKLNKYNDKWNNLELFNDVKELQIFIDYAKQDSLALLNALIKAQQIYWTNYNVDISSIWSTSTLSLKIFRLNFLNKIIPSLTRAQDYYIRKGYFGGATDHYKLYGENLYYYDINSLYPSVMLKLMPLNYIKYHNSIKKENFNNFFGFCLAEIECPKNINIPLLPYRNSNDDVIYPTGIWKGVYFSELLKTVIKHGYKVKPIDGHEFYKAYLFTNYVNHFYDIKKNAIGPTRFIAKMHLNQLYGYFGRSQELIITKNVNSEELEHILHTRIV